MGTGRRCWRRWAGLELRTEAAGLPLSPKDPLHTAMLQSEALFISLFKIVLVTVLYHMNFPFALQYLYLSFKIRFLITKINVYNRTEFQ